MVCDWIYHNIFIFHNTSECSRIHHTSSYDIYNTFETPQRVVTHYSMNQVWCVFFSSTVSLSASLWVICCPTSYLNPSEVVQTWLVPLVIQHSYWTWSSLTSFPIENGGSFHIVMQQITRGQTWCLVHGRGSKVQLLNPGLIRVSGTHGFCFPRRRHRFDALTDT